MSLPGAWWVFCKERFPVGSHALMILFFSLANALAAPAILNTHIHLFDFCVAYLVTFSFFFRLRCFDEIKDYEVDLEHNPTRPLARGILSLKQVKIMIACLTAFEFALIYIFNCEALVTHAVAVTYSFLMYKEFFIGKLIRPHLTTYAVTHTFVSILVGFSIASVVTNQPVTVFPKQLLLFGLVNWALFNLFEFARKTYAPSEERPNVDTYSSLFKSWGAAALSLSQVVFAIVVVAYAGIHLNTIFTIHPVVAHVIGALLTIVPALMYAAKPSEKSAKLFRNLTSLYLLVFYMILILQLFN